MTVVEQNQLQVITEDGNTVTIRFVGTAGNEDAQFLTEFFDTVRENFASRPSMILDFTGLQFCYSACIKVLMAFCTDSSSRPPIRMHIARRMTWQATSLRAMAGFSPQCVLVECDPSNPNAEGEPTYCVHAETETKEECFFAPTGNGSIVTEIVCKSCGVVLSKTSEYYD